MCEHNIVQISSILSESLHMFIVKVLIPALLGYTMLQQLQTMAIMNIRHFTHVFEALEINCKQSRFHYESTQQLGAHEYIYINTYVCVCVF